jgi:TadE-like protein
VTKPEGRNSSERGQSLVEVALLTPLLLALLIGGIELGRYAYIAILVGNAARAGAAYGAQGLIPSSDPAGILAAACNDFQNNGQNAGCQGQQTATCQITGQSAGFLYVCSQDVCGCDNGGSLSPNPPTVGYCNVPVPGGTGTNPTASACPLGGHWVVMVSVTAAGTFNSLFKFPGIPQSIAVSRTFQMRVAQN